MPQYSNFILKKLPQRLHQLHFHPLRQAADIVVRLDRDARPSGCADAFDHVRVERSLREKIGSTRIGCCLVEHVNEQLSNSFAFYFRVFHAFERINKQVACVLVNQPDVVVVAEHGDDFVRFSVAHHARIDENAGQPVSDGFMDQHGCNRAINTA